MIALVACGATEAQSVTTEGGAFIYEPQAIIDSINRAIEQDGSGLYLTCDPFVASGESVHTNDDLNRLILTFETSEDGLITHCRLYWNSNMISENIISSAGLYSAIIIDTLSPNNSDEILEGMSNIVTDGFGDINYTNGGVVVDFESIDGNNWLDISIKS